MFSYWCLTVIIVRNYDLHAVMFCNNVMKIKMTGTKFIFEYSVNAVVILLKLILIIVFNVIVLLFKSNFPNTVLNIHVILSL